MNRYEKFQEALKVKKQIVTSQISFNPRPYKDYAGSLIVLEGNDGAGKTTLAQMLVDKINITLVTKGYKEMAHYVRTPGGTLLGEDLRNILLNANYEIDPLSEAFLFQAQLNQCIKEVILPLLRVGKTVVCDRLIFSSFAYQGAGREMDFNMLNRLQDMSLKGVWPDFGFMLYNPIKKVSDGTRMEDAGDSFSLRVKTYYDYILKYSESARRLMIPIRVDPTPLKTLDSIWHQMLLKNDFVNTQPKTKGTP